VRVLDCRHRGPWLDFGFYQISSETVGLELGPLILVRLNEELLEINNADPVLKTEINGSVDPPC
jgi:hypothetical protein